MFALTGIHVALSSCAPRELAPKLKDVGQRVLLLAGDGDWLIPSADEGRRLQKLLQRCQLRVL